jgi:hypothetical protein
MTFVVPFGLVLIPSLEASPMTTFPRPFSIHAMTSYTSRSGRDELHFIPRPRGGSGEPNELASIFHRAVSGRCDGLRIPVWD